MLSLILIHPVGEAQNTSSLGVLSSHLARRRLARLGVKTGSLAAGAGVALAGTVAAVAGVLSLLVLRQHVLVLALRARLHHRSTSSVVATPLLATAAVLLQLQLPLVPLPRGPGVIRALGGALIDLVAGGGRVHRVAVGMHRLVPALGHGNWRWGLHRRGRGQGIAAVAGPTLGTSRRIQSGLVLTGRMALGGKWQVVGRYGTTRTRGGKIGRQLRRMLAGGRDLVAVLGAASHRRQRIAVHVLRGTGDGVLRRDSPGGKAARGAAVYGGVQNTAKK